MGNNKSLKITLLIFDIVIALFVLIDFCVFIADANYALFLKPDHSFWETYHLYPITNRAFIGVGAVCLFSIPFRILSLVKPDYVEKTPLKIIRMTIMSLEIFILCVIIICQVPYVLVNMKTPADIIPMLLGGGQLEAHLIIPPICLVYIILSKGEMKYNWKYNFLVVIPLFIYIISYAIGVFGLKTWDDFYKMKDMASKLSIAFLIIGPLLLLGLQFGLAMLLQKITNRGQKKKISSEE